MNLNEIKNKITNISQQIDGLDLSGNTVDEFSAHTKVNLDMATVYPMMDGDKVTPHLAYLFNTRVGWIHTVEYGGVIRHSPINVIWGYSSSDNTNPYSSMFISFQNTVRDRGIIRVKATALYNMDEFRYIAKTSPASHMYGKNDNGNPTHDFLPNSLKTINKNYTFYDIFNKYNMRINQYTPIDLELKYGYIHMLNDIQVSLKPLTTLYSDGRVIATSNEYIDLDGIMTLLIYENRLVYIRHTGTEFKYKIYSYPNLNIITTGVSNNLRDIYIKNKIYRSGIIGPTIDRNKSSEFKQNLTDNGFIIQRSKMNSRDENYSDIRIIDLYNIIGPNYLIFKDTGYNVSEHIKNIYYI